VDKTIEIWYNVYMEKIKCPKCEGLTHVKAGFTISGTQKYKCKNCGKSHNPTPRKNGYSEEEKTAALKYYYEGNSGRSTGRFFKMSKANATRWIKEKAEKEKNQPDESLPEECEVEELDEVYHFIGTKKTGCT